MALQVVSTAISVYKVTAVVDGAEQTQEFTLRRGELLPDWVTPYQQFVLTQTGMVRQVGDFPDPGLMAPEDLPTPVLMPEHNPRSVLGTGVTAPMVVTAAGDDVAGGPERADGELPSEGDTKPVWEDFAVEQKLLTRGKAESLKKADLIDEVRRQVADRRAAATVDEDEA